MIELSVALSTTMSVFLLGLIYPIGLLFLLKLIIKACKFL